MSTTIRSPDPSLSPHRLHAARRIALPIGLVLVTLAMLIAEPETMRRNSGPAWFALIDSWGTVALGLLTTLIVPIGVGEAVNRIIHRHPGVRRGMLIWAVTTLSTAYLLLLVLSGALAPDANTHEVCTQLPCAASNADLVTGCCYTAQVPTMMTHEILSSLRPRGGP